MLELASYYRPSSEAEVYDLLNALEDRMGHVNSAVVVATIRVFLHLTLSMTATHQQVGARAKSRGVQNAIHAVAGVKAGRVCFILCPCTVDLVHVT